MYDIERYRDYVQSGVINPLERLMGNEPTEEVNLRAKYGQPELLKKDLAYCSLLHTMMVPYYEMYLFGDCRLCKPNMESVRWQMKRAIEDDGQFGRWASEQDLMAAAEGWGENTKRIPESKRVYQYFYVLEALLDADCRQDWEELSQRLKDMLFRSEVYSDYKTDEVLCVLHAFTMIMQQDWPKERKRENVELLRLNWLFLKHYYSVMTRHIIGVKWTRFADVAKTVMESSQSFKPHMHIFYCGLMDCADELNLDKKQRRQMDRLLLQMQEELNRCEPSEILYGLCDTLFPEAFQRMLREHRPKTYKEVEDEVNRKDELIKQMKEQNRHLETELDKAKELLQNMVLSAIPIEDIDRELELYSPAMAWDLLISLDNSPVLKGIEVWRQHFPVLMTKYRQRLLEGVEAQKRADDAVVKMAERPAGNTVYNYASGATHDDKRRQVVLEVEEPKLFH